MTAETVIAFAGLSLFGVLFGTLIPENSCKNALKVLLSLIVTAALVRVIVGLELPYDLEGVFDGSPSSVTVNDTYAAAGRVIAEMTESEVTVLVEKFTGNEPIFVRCYVEWSGEEFKLTAINVECDCESPEGVKKYIAAMLKADPSLINVVRVG